MSHRISTWVRITFALLAVVFLWHYWASIQQAFVACLGIGPAFFLLPILFLVWNAIASGGWSLLLSACGVDIPLWRLAATRIESQAINLVLPSGVGGEVYRAAAMPEGGRPTQAIAVALDKCSDMLAEGVFLVGGFAAGAYLVPGLMPKPWLLGSMVLVACVLALSWKRLFPWVVALAIRRKWIPSEIKTLGRPLLHASWKAFLAHSIERILMLAELWLAAHWLGADLDWIGILFANSIVSGLGIFLAFAPGRFGSLETGLPLAFSLLGYPSTAGLSVALVRRARQLLVLASGLLLIQARQRPSQPETT